MHVLTEVDPAEIARLRERDEFFWIDLSSPSDEDVERLGEALGLHPVALEDTREFGQRPKLDPYGDHLLLVFYTAIATGDPGWPAEPLEVHVYLSGGYMVTVRRDACAIARGPPARRCAERGGRTTRRCSSTASSTRSPTPSTR